MCYIKKVTIPLVVSDMPHKKKVACISHSVIIYGGAI